MPQKELAVVHSGREVIYNLFYRTFIDSPGSDLYTMLEELLPGMEALEGEELQSEVAKLRAFVSKRASLEGAELAEYDLDTLRFYTRIMCLTDSAPNTESYYTSPEKLAAAEAQDYVLHAYSKYKFPKDPKYNELVDFISNEMRFMSFLAMKTVEAIENNGDISDYISGQHDFLVYHPLRWIEEYAAKLNTYKESERLHGPMANFMVEFVKSDVEFLKELI